MAPKAESTWRQEVVSVGEAPETWMDGSRLLRLEAYDSKLFAIMRGLHHLASRLDSGSNLTILADSQATTTHIQTDASGLGQDMEVQITELADTL